MRDEQWGLLAYRASIKAMLSWNMSNMNFDDNSLILMATGMRLNGFIGLCGETCAIAETISKGSASTNTLTKDSRIPLSLLGPLPIRINARDSGVAFSLSGQ